MYKPISEYGIIGDCRSSALVSDEGSIDWACLPDFDSPAQFLKILDDEKGGYFKISPLGFYQTNQKYKENTNILTTDFFNHQGNAYVTDFMPKDIKHEASGNIPEYGTKIIRLVKALQGKHEFELELKITPNFALGKISISQKDGRVIIQDDNFQYILFKKHHHTEVSNGVVKINFRLNEGEQEFFALDFYPKNHRVEDLTKQEVNEKLADLYFKTAEFWEWWTSLCKYRGAYFEQVLRSALTLKLLTYTPTGAVVAAPTTSLPEKVRGNLNWDYRYTWLRDASFTVYAFLGLGYIEEAKRFIGWLEKVCLKEADNLKIMYTIRGGKELREKPLKHLKGYMNSKPVRIGNGASNQKQFDIFGEILTAISLFVHLEGKLSEPMKDFVVKLVNFCVLHWQEKDTGIWETRNGERHNTYSKLMCWAGIDRGIRIAKKLKFTGINLIYWEKTREKIKKDLLKNGYNRELHAFTAYYNSKTLDSGTLNIPIVGLLPPDDRRVLDTINQIMHTLVVDWFVLRTSDTDNKLQKGEGTFFLSTFWLIDCLSLLGKVDEAKIWIERIIHDATPLGLYAEEFDPYTKSHLGNFPQAFTHLGFINSVLNLKQAEVFGKESQATTQSDRLAKVFKSLLGVKN